MALGMVEGTDVRHVEPTASWVRSERGRVVFRRGQASSFGRCVVGRRYRFECTVGDPGGYRWMVPNVSIRVVSLNCCLRQSDFTEERLESQTICAGMWQCARQTGENLGAANRKNVRHSAGPTLHRPARIWRDKRCGNHWVCDLLREGCTWTGGWYS